MNNSFKIKLYLSIALIGVFNFYFFVFVMMLNGCGGQSSGDDITANVNCSVVIMDEKQLSNAFEAGEAGIEDVQPVPGSNSYQVTMCNSLFTDNDSEETYNGDN